MTSIINTITRMRPKLALLCALIGGLRVLSGQHDLSDVLAALALSLALSLAGYLL